jgi:hypothetical protein
MHGEIVEIVRQGRHVLLVEDERVFPGVILEFGEHLMQQRVFIFECSFVFFLKTFKYELFYFISVSLLFIAKYGFEIVLLLFLLILIVNKVGDIFFFVYSLDLAYFGQNYTRQFDLVLYFCVQVKCWKRHIFLATLANIHFN